MKKLMYACLFLVIILNNSLSAQTGIRFGFRGGYSMATQYGIHLKDNPYTVDTSSRHGLAGGILVYYPITEFFSIGQEFLYVMKGSRHDIKVKDAPVTTYTKYNINYFEIPIVLRYTFVRLWSTKIYGCTGFALSIMLNGQYRTDGIVQVNSSRIPITESGDMAGVDIFDYSFLYGAGVAFTLFEKDCFFGYRFTIGWNTLMMPTFSGEDPAPLRNQDYIFTLGMFL